MGRDQVEAEDAPVVEVNGARGDRGQSGVRLAVAVAGDDHDLGEPRVDIDMEVEAGAAFFAAVAEGPDDGGGGVEEGAVDGEDLAMEVVERVGGFSGSGLEDFTSEMVEDRLQPGGVGQFVEVGEGAFAKFGDGEVFLGLPGLTEVFNGTEAAKRRVVECQQRGDEDIVEKECAIAMGVSVAEVVDQVLERADVFAAEDRFGPNGQRSGLGSLGAVRGGRVWGRTLLGCHAPRSCAREAEGAS